MKKIIAAFDGLKYSRSTRDHAIHLAQKAGAHLVGIFLEDRSYTGYKIYELIEEDGISQAKLKQFEKQDRVARDEAVKDFRRQCQIAGIEFSVHHDRAIAQHELRHESTYADLLIVDSSETLTHHAEKPPTLFIKHLLVDVQCPVLLVPARFTPIQKLVILYDGSPASVHAVKMCSYTLPQLKEMPANVLSVRSGKKNLHLPDNRLMKEFMKRHYPEAKYTVLKGIAEEEIIQFLKRQPANTLVVLGAYQRGRLSRLFRESMADTLMKKIKLPLLVAHGQ